MTISVVIMPDNADIYEAAVMRHHSNTRPYIVPERTDSSHAPVVKAGARMVAILPLVPGMPEEIHQEGLFSSELFGGLRANFNTQFGM